MARTFKDEYEKIYLPDGSVKLSFSEKGIGPRRSAVLARILIICLVLVLVAAACVLTGVDVVANRDLSKQAVLVCVVAMSILVYRTANTLIVRRSSIIIGKDGIVFHKRGKTILNSGTYRLAFVDISGWGIRTIASKTASRTSYIYARSGERELRVTRYLAMPLAAAILGEIALLVN